MCLLSHHLPSAGFSTLFDQPSYQTAAVQSYLTNSGVQMPPSGAFNAAGRAYPDVSALGINYVVGAQLSMLLLSSNASQN